MEIFVVKTLVLISFFVFRFILEDTEGKEDTKMEMMKKLSMRRLKKRYKSSLATGWARLHSSEEFEFRRAIEGKAENEYGENGEEEFDEQLMTKMTKT